MKGMNFDEWKALVQKRREGMTHSEIHNHESQLGVLSQYDPEYGQTHTITYNVTGNFDASNLPTEIKSTRTLKINIPIPYGATGGVDANVAHTYENGVLTIQDVQQDIEIAINVGDVLYENAKLGDYLYSDWTFGPTQKAGYLGRCIGLATENEGKSVWCKYGPMMWWKGEYPYNVPLEKFTTSTDAITDLNGYTNTKTLLLNEDANNTYPAAKWASEQFQGNGYLPAAGELYKTANNIYRIFGNCMCYTSTGQSNATVWYCTTKYNKPQLYSDDIWNATSTFSQRAGVSFLQLSGKPSGNPKYEYVDLGLPSGTLWATMNVGANSPTEYGNYYKYGKGSKTYDNADGSYQGTEVPLDLSKDTARQVCGGDWHMPTKEQQQELIDETTYTWVTDYNGSGVNGGLFTAQNGNFVFFPAGGCWFQGGQNDVGSIGFYWSSTRFGTANAYYLYVADGRKGVSDYYRYAGSSIRPVIG